MAVEQRGMRSQSRTAMHQRPCFGCASICVAPDVSSRPLLPDHASRSQIPETAVEALSVPTRHRRGRVDPRRVFLLQIVGGVRVGRMARLPRSGIGRRLSFAGSHILPSATRKYEMVTRLWCRSDSRNAVLAMRFDSAPILSELISRAQRCTQETETACGRRWKPCYGGAC